MTPSVNFLTFGDVRDQVRATALQGFRELVLDLGGDADALLRAVHLRPDSLGRSDAFVPLRSVAEVIGRAASTLACPDFALRLAARQTVDILGPAALIARHSATAAAGVESIGRNLRSYSPALEIRLEPLSQVVVRYRFTVVAPLADRVGLDELGIGVSYGVFRLLIGSHFRPLEVTFPHARRAPNGIHERFFGCPVRFDAGDCGIDLRCSDLLRPRAADDPDVRDVVIRYLESTEGPGNESPSDEVRRLCMRMLATGHATAVQVAAHLGINVRTLQRRLAAEGTTFEALLDEVRRDRAEQYLRDSGLSLAEVAALVGYSHPSSLSRASLRWFGAPPRTVRSRQRADRVARS